MTKTDPRDVIAKWLESGGWLLSKTGSRVLADDLFDALTASGFAIVPAASGAQSEARAIALAAAGQVSDNEDARCVETLVEKLVASTLESLAAERARLARERDTAVDDLTTIDGRSEQWTKLGRALARAEAAEAENARLRALLEQADKVIAPFADIADLIDSESEGISDSDEFQLLFHDCLLASWKLSLFCAARQYQEARNHG